MELVEKRKATLINFAYFTFIAAGYYLFLKYAFWLVAPFVFAFAVAMFLQKPVAAISKRTRLKKGFAAAAALILILAVVIGLLVFAGYRITVEFKGFGQYVASKLEDLPNFIKLCESKIIDGLYFLPDSVERTAAAAIEEFADRLIALTESGAEASIRTGGAVGGFDFSSLVAPLGGLISTAKQIPAALTAALVGVISCFFMTCDYDGVTNMIKKSVSEEREKALVRTKKLFVEIVGKMFKSYATIIFITFCEISIGLNILKMIGVYKNGYIAAVAFVTAMVDIFPVLGTGTVMIPWAIISLLTGKIGLGAGLFVIYGIITVIRQILEPRLVAMNVGLPPVLTLLGMYVGLQLFGVIGIFILPMTFVIVKALNDEGIIRLWGRNNGGTSGNGNAADGKP